MKKQALMAAALAAVMMTTGVQASSLTEVTQMTGEYDWVDGTNLLKGLTDTGYALSTVDGTMLTEGKFYSSMEYRDGFITAFDATVEDTNACGGVLDLEGQTVVDFVYGDIDIKSDKWIAAVKLEDATADKYDYKAFIGDGYWLITGVDIYYVGEEGSQKIAELTRDEYAQSNAIGDYIFIESRADGTVTAYDRTFAVVGENLSSVYDDYGLDFEINEDEYVIYSYNGQQGIQDTEGNIIVEAAYYTVRDIDEGYAVVYDGEHEGLIDLEGNLIVPMEYDDILYDYYPPTGQSKYVSAGYICVVKDGMIGYYDVDGDVTMEPSYAKDALEYHGASCTYTDMQNNVHILAADGTDTTLPAENSEIRSLDYAGGVYYYFYNENYDYGLIDWKGEVLVPATNNSVGMSGDGRYVLVEEEDYETYDLYEVSYPLDEAGDMTV